MPNLSTALIAGGAVEGVPMARSLSEHHGEVVWSDRTRCREADEKYIFYRLGYKKVPIKAFL